MLKAALEPVISQILMNIIQLAAIFVFAGLARLWKTIHQYLSAHLSAKQMEVLQMLASQAYSLIEAEYKSLNGAEKLQKALDFVQTEAVKRGMPFKLEAARAAIENAWMLFEGQFKWNNTSKS